MVETDDLLHVNDEAAARLRAAARVLMNRVGHWTDARWAVREDDGRSRADVMHELVQQLADLAATVEHRPVIAVPRLENDLALPDQFLVMINDLLEVGSPREVLDTATATIRSLPL